MDKISIRIHRKDFYVSSAEETFFLIEKETKTSLADAYIRFIHEVFAMLQEHRHGDDMCSSGVERWINDRGQIIDCIAGRETASGYRKMAVIYPALLNKGEGILAGLYLPYADEFIQISKQ